VWYKKGTNKSGTAKNIYVGITPPHDMESWEQEEDVLDTWFSSGIWTFSVLGWPSAANLLKKFHPTKFLDTGYEIITLWVSRMIMMSLFAVGEIPFENVYLHGMVLDKNGKKMSKSKGNGIDPIEMIEKFGTDATRLSLIVGNTPGNDTRISEEKIADFRNFTNKLWNISRFMLLNIKEPQPNAEAPVGITLSDKWILSRLGNVIKQVSENIEKFNFSYAGEQLRDFTWNELADWYLEIAKVEGEKEYILNYILNTILKLWHPFLPFVTEQIWSEIYGENKILMAETWPQFVGHKKSKVKDESFLLIQNIITDIRALRSENKVEPAQKLNVIISGGKQTKLLLENVCIIKALARLDVLEIKEQATKVASDVSFVCGAVEIFVNLAGVVDFAKEKERLQKEIDQIEPYIVQLEKKLANKQFVDNAPAEIVENERAKLEDAKSKILKLKEQYNKIA
jgi:valyl-tRNA synthetase